MMTTDKGSDTPRTDAVAETEVHRGVNNMWEVRRVDASFAQTLERELTAANQRIAELEANLVTAVDAMESRLCTIIDLRAELATAQGVSTSHQQSAQKWKRLYDNKCEELAASRKVLGDFLRDGVEFECDECGGKAEDCPGIGCAIYEGRQILAKGTP